MRSLAFTTARHVHSALQLGERHAPAAHGKCVKSRAPPKRATSSVDFFVQVAHSLPLPIESDQ